MAGESSPPERVAARGGGQDRMASPVRPTWRRRRDAVARRYTYRDGGTAWGAFPEAWRRIARENARPALLDFRNSIGNYPSAADLTNVVIPLVCSYGARSPNNIVRLTRSLASAIPTARTHQIEGARHAAPFDATSNFVQLITDTITSQQRQTFG